MTNPLDLLRDRLRRKQLAYQGIFLDGNNRLNPAAQIVLADLKRVAGINKGGIVISPVSRMVDSHATAYRAGQRDMWLRIMKMIGLDEGDNVEE